MMKQFSWPKGWSVQTFHDALLAVRQHRVPDFSADVGLKPDTIRAVVTEMDEQSEQLGHYLFDTHIRPEAWQPAPHIPRMAMESIEKVYVKDFSNPERILKLSAAGQDSELLLTRACRDCGDVIAITIGTAAAAVRKFGLEGGKYQPPWRCRACKEKKRRSSGFRMPVGAQLQAKAQTRDYKAIEKPAEEASVE